MPNRTPVALDFGHLGRRHLLVGFRGGDLRSHGGAMLVRQIDALLSQDRTLGRADRPSSTA